MSEFPLGRFEEACESALRTPSAENESILSEFVLSNVQTVCYVLGETRNPYAQYFVFHSLLRQVTSSWRTLDTSSAVELKNFLVSFVFEKNTTLPDFVLKISLQVISRITKLGWMSDDSFQTTVSEVRSVVERGESSFILALQLLDAVVNDINTSLTRRLLTQHRKVLSSFRDRELFSILRASQRVVDELPRIEENVRTSAGRAALSLIHSVLSYDFMGLLPEETSDESFMVQLPSNWKQFVEDEKTVPLFFSLYKQFGVFAMKCLVQLSAVRRSVFSSEAQRRLHIDRLLRGVVEVLRDRIGFEDDDNILEISRLLSKLKSSNFPLQDIVETPTYEDWITQVAQFTVRSIESVEEHSNSAHYLLGLFSRLLNSYPSLRLPRPSRLPEVVPPIIESFVRSRLQFIESCASSGEIASFIDDEERIQEMLSSVPFIIRSLYEVLGSVLVGVLDPIVMEYGTASSRNNVQELFVLEEKLAFFLYLSGGVLSQRGFTSSSVSRDGVDGILISRALQVCQFSQQQSSVERKSLVVLERSVLFFLQQVRAVYIGDQTITATKIYDTLTEMFGINNHKQLVEIITNRVVENLSIWASNYEILEGSLVLFKDFAHGYSTQKILVKLSAVRFLMSSQSTETLQFMLVPSNAKLRSTYYSTLITLLNLDTCTEAQFHEFLDPQRVVCERLSQLAPQHLSEPGAKMALVGVLRDLCGMCRACKTKRTFERFFEWIFPSNIELFERVAGELGNDPTITVPLLRFVEEFSTNRGQRILFGPSSPNGILLFKSIAKVLTAYGQCTLDRKVNSDVYSEKMKPIKVCLSTLTSGLTGRYCNFGVFSLYNDPVLSDVLDVAINLCLTAPVDALLSYPKISRGFHNLLDVLFLDHCHTLAELSSPMFLQLVRALNEGIKSMDMGISSQACSAVDHLLTYYYNQTAKGSATSQKIAAHFSSGGSSILEIMRTIMEILTFEESRNQYSLSRPLLALIVVDPTAFDTVRREITERMGEQNGQETSNAFDRLMQNVSQNLEFRNRDQFSQNLTFFRKLVK